MSVHVRRKNFNALRFQSFMRTETLPHRRIVVQESRHKFKRIVRLEVRRLETDEA
jgi:hypothetical protein